MAETRGHYKLIMRQKHAKHIIKWNLLQRKYYRLQGYLRGYWNTSNSLLVVL